MITTMGTAKPTDRLQDNWPEFLTEVQLHAAKMLVSKNRVYLTDVPNLAQVYLDSLPADGRQHYNCNACLLFLNRYGNLVVIDDNLNLVPLFWDKTGSSQKFFDTAVKNLYKKVSSANIKNIFKADGEEFMGNRTQKNLLGLPRNIGNLTGYTWTHFHFILPERIITGLNKESHVYLERFQMLSRITAELKVSTIDEAISLINAGSVYRGAEDLPLLNTMRPVLEKLNSVKKNKDNFMWTMIFENDALYHFRGTALYTFLQDLEKLDDVDKAIENYGYKKDPANYGRVKSEVSTTQIKLTKEFLEKAGLVGALQRRFAKITDIPAGNFIWTARGLPVVPQQPLTDGFENIKTKGTKPVPTGSTVNSEVKMTWAKFNKTILPTAQELSVVIEDPTRFMGITTEAVPNAGNLFMWNNPFAWYYNGGGADGEMRKRVIEAGGQYDNNTIRCSLMWNTCTDLDLHCVTPSGKHIYYGDKRPAPQKGWLDVDMNAGGCNSTKPVENIRFEKGFNHEEGEYRFYVHNFANRDSNGNPYKVELEVHGKIFTFEGKLARTSDRTDVFRFEYKNAGYFKMNGGTAMVNGGDWGFDNNVLKVKCIVKSPNTWDDVTLKQNHMFFLIEGMKHNGESSMGFLPEYLSAGLKPHRKVLEHYALNNPVQGIEEADAFGLGFNQDSDWNLKVQVKTGKLTQTIVIDRYE